MLHLHASGGARHCDGITRRDLLRVGGIGLGGWTLPGLLRARPNVPPFVMVPEPISPVGPDRPGQHAGCLGAAYDPYRVNSDPNSADYSPGSLQPGPDVPVGRIDHRRALLAQVSEHARF